MIKNIEKINIMSIYYNASLNRNLRASRTFLAKNKKRLNIRELKKNLKKMISEKEKKLKEINESLEIKNEDIKIEDKNILLNNEEIPNQISNDLLEKIDNSNNSVANNMKNKLDKEEYKYSYNNIIIDNKNGFQASDYKNHFLVNIGLEIDDLAKFDLKKENNKNEKQNLQYKCSKIYEENSSEEIE